MTTVVMVAHRQKSERIEDIFFQTTYQLRPLEYTNRRLSTCGQATETTIFLQSIWHCLCAHRNQQHKRMNNKWRVRDCPEEQQLIQKQTRRQTVKHWQHGNFAWTTPFEECLRLDDAIFVHHEPSSNSRTTVSKSFSTTIEDPLGEVSSFTFLAKPMNFGSSFSPSVNPNCYNVSRPSRLLHHIHSTAQITTLVIFPLFWEFGITLLGIITFQGKTFAGSTGAQSIVIRRQTR